MRIKQFVISLLVWLPLLSVAQMPAHYGQYLFNGMAVNPAYAGSREALSTTLLFRQQWTGFPGAPKTISAGIHGPSRELKNNFGFNLLHDQFGVTKSTRISAAYAYRLDFLKGKLSFGLEVGNEIRQYRFDDLYLTDPIDNRFNGNNVFSIPRIGFGTYYYSDRFFLGFSVPELVQYRSKTYEDFHPFEIDYKYYFLAAGCVIDANPDIKLKPSVMLKYMPSIDPQADFNLNLIFRDRYWAGISFRTNDAIGAMAEFQLNQQFRLGYMYEYTIAGLRGRNAGTHELMLRYEFGYTVKDHHPRYF